MGDAKRRILDRFKRHVRHGSDLFVKPALDFRTYWVKLAIVLLLKLPSTPIFVCPVE